MIELGYALNMFGITRTLLQRVCYRTTKYNAFSKYVSNQLSDDDHTTCKRAQTLVFLCH